MREWKGPVYQQIYNDLKQQLQDGGKQPGDELPSENALATQYETTRMTVRKALHMLEREGFIYPWAGKGYYVSQPSHNTFSLDYPVEPAASSYQRINVIRADANLQRIFSLNSGSRVIKICRGEDTDGRRTALDFKYLPYAKGKPMLEQELNYFVPFPDIVAQIVPPFLFYTRLEIHAVLPPKPVAELLNCPETVPVLLLERFFMDQNDSCIAYGRRYQLQSEDAPSLTALSGYPTRYGK